MSVGFKIIARDSIRTASLSATSEAVGFTVDNLAADNKSTIWRSTSLSTQTITATWVNAQNLAAVGMAFTNLIVGSTVQIKLYTNSGDPSPVFQTSPITVNFAYSIPIGQTTIGFDSFPHGGGNYFFTSFDQQTVEKIEVTITSTSNPDGVMEIARLVSGPVIDIVNGADFGSVVSYDDNIISKRPDSGDLIADEGVCFKNIQFELGDLNPSDKSMINNMSKGVGKNVPIFVSGQDLSPVLHDEKSFQIYGNLNNDVSISTMSYNKHTTSLSIIEI